MRLVATAHLVAWFGGFMHQQRVSRSVVCDAARRPMVLVTAFAIAAGVGLWGSSAAAGSTPAPAIPGAVAVAAMVLLSGNLHPMARPEFDVGRMDPGMRLSGISLLFQKSPEQQALLKVALASIEDPNSSNYHRWLTPEQYAVAFGASSGDIVRATAWLTSQGLSVDGPSRTATRLSFSGTIAQIEQAFRTEMHRYRVDGANHFAMNKPPSVPRELASLVLGIHGLHDFRARTPQPKPQPQYTLPVPQPDGGTVPFPILAPADFAKIYGVGSLYTSGITGAGQSIAVIAMSDFNDVDIAAFRTTFGLPSRLPARMLVPNTGPAIMVSAAYFETVLDLEWTGAVAPDANIISVFPGSTRNLTDTDVLFYAIEQRAAPVISTSIGACEDWYTSADAGFLEDYGALASLEGITVVVAAGDTGAAACDSQSDFAAHHGKSVIFTASVPSFVAVGGSQFQLTADNQSTYLDAQLGALSYIPESAWNETLVDIDAGYGGLGAGGGGASRLFAKPYWQIPYTPADGARDLPDIALSASADTLPYAISMSWTAADGDAQAPQPEALTAYGGTSAAAPAFAGILALLNQTLAEANPGAPVGLGNVNPLLYALAGGTTSNSAFHDITTGDNVVPCGPGSPDCPASPPYQFGYTSQTGYDQTTGLGTVDATKLAAAYGSMIPTSTSLRVIPSGATEGSTLQLTATVASQGTTDSMTGSVTFYFITSANDAGMGGTLGVSPITASTLLGKEGGSALLTVRSPGELNGSGAQVGAFYGGDPHYLASWSALASASGTSTLAICPTSVTLAAGERGLVFATTGGNPPIRWGIYADRTCVDGSQTIACSSIDGGAFTAGPKTGSAMVVAIDQDDSYATAVVTVTADGADGSVPPLPAISCASDSGEAGGSDAADAQARDGSEPDAPEDAQAPDAARQPVDSSANKTGCGCKTDGSHSSRAGWQGAALLALMLARRFLSRPRPHRRGSYTCCKRSRSPSFPHSRTEMRHL